MFIHISIEEKFTSGYIRVAASATKVGTGWEWKAESKRMIGISLSFTECS